MFQLRGIGLGDAAHDFCIGVPGLDAADFQHCVDQYRRDMPATVSTQPTSSPPVITFPSIPGITTQNPTPGTTVVTTGVPTAGFFAPGWYTTLPGLALLGAAAFVGYKVYTRKKPAA